MFALPRAEFPESPTQLAAALEEGLRVFVTGRDGMVSIRGENLRDLTELKADLSGAVLDENYRPALPRLEDTTPAVFSRSVLIKGNPLTVLRHQFELSVEGRNVELHQAKSADGKLWLVLAKADEGQITLSIDREELAAAITAAAREQAGAQGIKIEKVELDLETVDAHRLRTRITVHARKLFLRALLHLRAAVAVSDELVATVSDLSCKGEGAIASLACAAIDPHLRKIEGRAYPLTGLPLGGMKLRDVRLDLPGSRVVATAEFGAA